VAGTLLTPLDATQPDASKLGHLRKRLNALILKAMINEKLRLQLRPIAATTQPA
jgi:hypothetical protein